jgi:galactose oxidase-like protein
MITARAFHTATLLSDGRVLIAGGLSTTASGPGFGNVLASAEIYDPNTGSFIATGDMTAPHWGHAATLLDIGKVLVFGAAPGYPGGGAPEIYDPSSGSFAWAGNANGIGWGAKLVSLLDGTVLMVGGYGGAQKASLYDPASGASRLAAFLGPLDLFAELTYHTATLVPNGKVLIAGGSTDPGYPGDWDVSQAMLYDPRRGTFQGTGSLLQARMSHTATLLLNGSVLITGGYDEPSVGKSLGVLSSAELYDPDAGTFTNAGMMTSKRSSHTATLLRDGRVLLVGGGIINDYNQWDGESTAELYVPAGNPMTPDCGNYKNVGGSCRRIGILPWYAAIPGQWETDLVLSAGPHAVRFGYVMSAALTYDGIGHNLLLEDYRGSFTAESVDHLDLKTGDSYGAGILAGVDCYGSLASCQTVPSMGALIVTVDGPDAAALEGPQIRETFKLLASDGSVVSQMDASATFRDQASRGWRAAITETPRSRQAQPGATITAFAVANLSVVPQAVVVKVFDESGNLVASAKTPVLNKAQSLGPPYDDQGWVGGVYSATLSNFLGMDLAPSPLESEFHGTVTFEGEAGENIAPLVMGGNWPLIVAVPVIPE